MIDFRYHLVSIAAVFLALAVGIVLGAGPLQNSIGSTLQSEVTRLRAEKASLRAELDASTAGEKARDDFGAATLPAVVSGRLAGADVALVVLPDVDQRLVQETAKTLGAAGATVTASVTVAEAMVSTRGREARQQVARELAPGLGLRLAPGEDDPAATVLAAALVQGGQGAATPDDAARSTALAALEKAGLVATGSTSPAVAHSVVVLSGEVAGEASERASVANAQVAIAQAADRQANAALLASASIAPTDTAQSVVTTARKNADLIGKLSTVDDADIPLGQASIALGLREQSDGGSGQYGLDADATAAYPTSGS